MSGFNGSGTFVISAVGLPYVTGTTISSTVGNQWNTDLATGLSTCLTKDGQSLPTANIPMSGFKLTGLGSATTTADALAYGQVSAVLSGLSIAAAGATSGQLVFPATQNASTNANTLDDYEEGTFDPGLTFGGAFVGGTLTAHAGQYIKIGKMVQFSLRLTIGNPGSSTGEAKITNLPFTADSSNEAAAPCAMTASTLNLSAGYTQYVGQIDVSATTISMLQLGDNISAQIFTQTDFTGNTTAIRMSGTYRASA